MAKAQSLQRIAREMGAPLNEYLLTLSDEEAYELLDFMAAGGLGEFENQDLFLEDVRQAKREKNPMAVLEQFTIFGFKMISTRAMH